VTVFASDGRTEMNMYRALSDLTSVLLGSVRGKTRTLASMLIPKRAEMSRLRSG